MKSPNKTISPVIKWSGSKRKVALELSKNFLIKKRYIEPFLGGGSLIPFRGVKDGLASDIIPELINLWNEIKYNPNNVSIEYKMRWERLQYEGHSVFYEVRENFNKTKDPHDFLFLTRTCVNGLIRYNTIGEFNNSMHKNRPGINPTQFSKILKEWNYYAQGVKFVNQDYRETLSIAKKDDFIFLDPPYGGTKGRYTKLEFDISDFYNQLEKLNSKGVSWMLTFDGNAGEREYDFVLPKDLYIEKTFVNTGNSPFTKLMKTSIDQINEAVYTNYKTPVLLKKLELELELV
jgi:DNA adenine methylase